MLPRDFTSLEQIKIASPCPADWGAMHGDDQVRHCSQCDRKVYNLSELTRHEAMTLLLRNEGHVCVRFYRREDGKVMTRDCGKAVKKRKRVAAWLTAAACAIGFARLAPGLAPSNQEFVGDAAATPTPVTHNEVMGAPVAPAELGKPVIPRAELAGFKGKKRL
ncbi:MAG TPA: hypothetical protein VG944_10005 [Fimbriimonas sp.]|nr:hypothetical protein [Fimbriimonas sp.]